MLNNGKQSLAKYNLVHFDPITEYREVEKGTHILLRMYRKTGTPSIMFTEHFVLEKLPAWDRNGIHGLDHSKLWTEIAAESTPIEVNLEPQLPDILGPKLDFELQRMYLKQVRRLALDTLTNEIELFNIYSDCVMDSYHGLENQNKAISSKFYNHNTTGDKNGNRRLDAMQWFVNKPKQFVTAYTTQLAANY